MESDVDWTNAGVLVFYLVTLFLAVLLSIAALALITVSAFEASFVGLFAGLLLLLISGLGLYGSYGWFTSPLEE